MSTGTPWLYTRRMKTTRPGHSQRPTMMQQHFCIARLEGDTWTVTISNGEIYEVPLAAIEGG